MVDEQVGPRPRHQGREALQQLRGATVTGTTEGTIQAFACFVFGAGSTALTLSVALLDAAQNSSNILSTQLNRPSETRGVPPAGETGGGAMERLRP
ncbi:MAG: hypothetical protein HY002_20440 [Candidatus Rokubacteria bacterium]|nr:hypothetical protein [Candidatus Rokubacteria bacterium]